MAQKVLVQFVDDLDGTENEEIETLSFGMDGVQYEIDLGAENSARLRESVAPYIDSARRVGGRLKRGTATKASSPAKTASSAAREQTRAIRDWARQQGHDLSDRGRIPGHIIQAFEEAHANKNNATSKKKRSGGRKKATTPDFSG